MNNNKNIKTFKNHVIFKATGRVNQNGDIYSKDLKVNFDKEVPITFEYSDKPENILGKATNIRFKDCKLIADLNISASKKVTKKLDNRIYPGVCFTVKDSKKIPIKEAELISIGMLTYNIDETIKPINLNKGE